MKGNFFFIAAFIAIAMTASLVFAEHHEKAGMADHMQHHGQDVQNIYAPVMDKMHQEMMVKATGDADIDFIKGMIPHHQGAIDMAKIALGKAQDERVRKLAQEIISAQEKEIAMMQEWLTELEEKQ